MKIQSVSAYYPMAWVLQIMYEYAAKRANLNAEKRINFRRGYSADPTNMQMAEKGRGVNDATITMKAP